MGLLYLWVFLLLPALPEMIILGIVYWKIYNKVKRKKLIAFIFSILGSFMYPVIFYLIGYYSSNGWKNGTAEIFLFVIFALPFLFFVYLIGFLIIGMMKNRDRF